MTSRRRFRLDSERGRGIRDLTNILQNDDDSDIEEDTTRNETEEAADEFRAGQEQLDLNDEDIPERGQSPIRTRRRSKSRETGRSRVRSTCGEGLVQHASIDDVGPSHGPHHTGMTSRLTGRHFMERIPATGSKTKVARVCKVCADTTKKQTGKRGRKETVFFCPDCNVPLCYYPCFKKFHTMKDYTA